MSPEKRAAQKRPPQKKPLSDEQRRGRPPERGNRASGAKDVRAAKTPAGEVVAAAPAPVSKAVAPRPAVDRNGALVAEGLSKNYGELVALAPLDLSVAPGQRVALIGHNGSGKTTLLRMAAGLLEPSDGTINILGQPAGSLPARTALAYLADQPSFYEDLSVWEHLEYVARLHGVADWEQHAADLLGHLGIYERADDLPTTFSRGLRQKASIALAFIRPFELLLVDEPFVGLDAAGKRALLELLDAVQDDGATLVVATHELSFVQGGARCLALRNGEVIHDGSADGLDLTDLVAG